MTNLSVLAENSESFARDYPYSVVLTERGTLVFLEKPGDFREIVFDLAARKEKAEDSATRFWGKVGENLLLAIKNLPNAVSLDALSPLSDDEAQAFLEEAPPMRGEEYLSVDAVKSVWGHVAAWAELKIAVAGGVAAFLAERAPKWRNVGRLVFHLAENQANPARPFAFMVARVADLSDSGEERHEPLALSLVRHSKANDKMGLASLLYSIQAAADKLQWVADMAKNESLFRPTALTIEEAHRFLLDAPKLEALGFLARIPNWWRRRPPVKLRVAVGDNKRGDFGPGCFFDFNMELMVGDEPLDQAELARFLESEEKLVYFKGQWVEADRKKLKDALSRWGEAKEFYRDGLSFVEAMRLLSGAPGFTPESEEDGNEPPPWGEVQAGKRLAELLKELRGPKAARAPLGLKADLRPYQAKGLSWLALMRGLGLGACLADDMGLGKTVQVLALLLLAKEKEGPEPSLLVAPASLLANWRLEAKKHAPDLRLAIFHHSENSREKLAYWIKRPETLFNNADLVVTSYSLAVRHLEFFASRDFRAIVIDEAQAIKNSSTAQSGAVRNLKGRFKVALTGTPIENGLTDLWSIFDFLNPGLLGSANKFKEILGRLESRGGDQYAPLRRLVAPYVLRRLKTDKTVITDLPDKTEMTTYCWLTPIQAKFYAKVVVEFEAALKDLAGDPGAIFKRRALVLQTLLKLKQLCNHPAQLTGDMDWRPELSGKFQRLAELARGVAERGEKVLIFSQFREIIAPLDAWLTKIFKRSGLILHGGTPVGARLKLVEDFQSPDGPPYFILSLKAGGTGLNLTAAAHVIHFDRWWNPAVEDQATDRAYRVGQSKNVLVHKFVTQGTMEERIDGLLSEKRGLAEEVLGQRGGTGVTDLDDKALLELIRLDLDRAVG